MKQKRSTAGFTLVELIVVIAILGILAGVGTVAYSGYITAANKSVDRETVGNLIYAATLADYADPSLYDNGSAMIAVTADGTKASGSEGLQAALEDSVGDLNSVKLKYGDWSGAVNGATLSGMVDSLSTLGYTDADGKLNDGMLPVSYAGAAEELWDVVNDTVSATIINAMGVSTKGEAMAKMAETTLEIGTDAETMGTYWAAPNVQMGGLVTKCSGTKAFTYTGAFTARGYAFAEYAKSNYDLTETEIAALTPAQAVQAGQIFVMCYNGLKGDTLKTAAQKYISSGQSKSDGMVYYALMYNVNDVSSGENPAYDPASEGYMDSIGSYVSAAGTILSNIGEDGTLRYSGFVSELSGYSGPVVMLTVTKTDGELACKVVPSDADPRKGQ